MNINALQNLLSTLNAAAISMNDAAIEMKAFQAEHPALFRHGCELLGATDTVEDWIKGIASEIEGYEVDPSNQCDGCRQKLRIADGLHRDKDGKSFMACTAHLYI